MTNAHTPGPWRVKGFYEGSVTIQALRHHTDAHGASTSYMGDIATTRPVGNPKVRKANARLIAAAPCLLDALKRARRYVADLPIVGDADLAVIDAAILKATTRTSHD